MKKLVTKIMAVVMIVACAFGVSACGGGKTTVNVRPNTIVVGYTDYELTLPRTMCSKVSIPNLRL